MVKIKKYFRRLWFRLQGKELKPIILSKRDKLVTDILDNRVEIIQMIHFENGDEEFIDVNPLNRKEVKKIKEEFKDCGVRKKIDFNSLYPKKDENADMDILSALKNFSTKLVNPKKK